MVLGGSGAAAVEDHGATAASAGKGGAEVGFHFILRMASTISANAFMNHGTSASGSFTGSG